MKDFDENNEKINNDDFIDDHFEEGDGRNAEAENSKCNDEGGGAFEEKPCVEEESNEIQEATDDYEEKTDSEEASQHIEEQTVRYSSSYEPPNYLPNFSSSVVNEISESKKKKTSKRGVAIAVVSLCVVFSFIMGIAAGYVGMSIALKDNTAEQPKESIDIIKNDGNITVNEVTGDNQDKDLSISEVVTKVGGSVVEIAISDTGSAGSGVIFSQTDNYGYIVTNYHVVEDGDDIGVRLIDGREYSAEYIDGDEFSDIAVLKMKKKSNEEFTVATLGSSDALLVGEEIVAIGNPLGTLGGTVTDGIISALDRQIVVDNIPMTLLQHNAAINSGNSGGGLFNLSGELVGIVNAKKAAEGIEGLGFAIPIDLVSDIITEILEKGYISGRPTLGIEVQYGTLGWFGPTGLFVVESNNPDFKTSDRIVSVDGRAINSVLDYYAALDSSKIGKTIEVIIYRNNLQRKIEVVVEEYRPSAE